MSNEYFIYIMTNKYNTVLYTDVTNNLIRRSTGTQRRSCDLTFTSRYRVTKLVYFPGSENRQLLHSREKQN